MFGMDRLRTKMVRILEDERANCDPQNCLGVPRSPWVILVGR